MKRQGGFVLATVLVVLAVMAVGATFIALWVQNLRDSAHMIQTQTQANLDSQSTKATLLYLVATQGMTYGGLRADGSSGISDNPEDMGSLKLAATGTEIKLDDSPYRGIGNILFSIQDEGGLFSVNYFATANMRKFLNYFGVATPQAIAMADKLLDYTDPDNISRLHGAERGRYAQAGLGSPANRPLANPQEVRRVMDWVNVRKLWHQSAFQRYTTTQARGFPNVNTAPFAVLQTMEGVSQKGAGLILDARQKRAITLAEQVEQITGQGLGIPLDNVNRFSSRYLRISIWHKDQGAVEQIHIELTPKSPMNLKPWLIAYENKIQIWPELVKLAPGTLEGALAKTLLSAD
jgi:general secretion pathway protein K